MQLIQPYTLFVGNAADWIAALALLSLIILGMSYLRAARGHDSQVYHPRLSWLRAGIYFSAGLILSWSLGVTQSLLSLPLVTEQQLTSWPWLAYTLCYAVVLWIGYMVIWPKGTFQDGRAAHPVTTTLFGLAWGLCHAQVFLCLWAIAELSGLNSYWVAAITYLLLSGYNFAFHQFFWDVQVSPPHNIEAWNMKKVQYCHSPNLLLGFVWLAIWGNFGLWVLFQTFALTVSAHNMRFPAPGDSYQGRAGEMR